MKLSVDEILSEATKALRAEYTMGFVPTSSSGGSPAHTFTGDAFAFRSRESFIRGHVQHLSAAGAKAYRRGRTGTVLKIIGCKSIGWLPFSSCSSCSGNELFISDEEQIAQQTEQDLHCLIGSCEAPFTPCARR